MKRLLVFTENYLYGGGNRYLVDMVNGISHRFDEVVIANNKGGLFKEDIERLCGRFVILDVVVFGRGRLFGLLSALPNIARVVIFRMSAILDPLLFLLNLLSSFMLLARVRPTAVLSCNGGYPGAGSTVAMTTAARLRGIPCALSIVSMPTARTMLMYPYEWALDRIARSLPNAIIVNAGAIRTSLSKLRAFTPERIAVVHNGLETLTRQRDEDRAARAHLTIGGIMRMDKAKGIFFLLEAFAALAGRYDHLRLVMVGKGSALGQFTDRVAELGLQGRVVTTGYYEGDINELLDGFDIYIFPTLWEGFPYSVLEAMRAGCAIVATTVGGIPEAIADGESGLLVPPGSARMLEVAIEKLILDPKLRGQLRSQATMAFNNMFTLTTMHGTLRNVFEDAGLLA